MIAFAGIVVLLCLCVGTHMCAVGCIRMSTWVCFPCSSYAEMRDTLASICEVTTLPVIADADTGYGNAVNVRRTVRGYAQAGAACVMIEDQVAPKRCGHVSGKSVVSREEAFARIQAAVDARDEGGHSVKLKAGATVVGIFFDKVEGRGRTELGVAGLQTELHAM